MTTNTKEYSREYYLKNKDRMKEISRKWRRKNKEYFIAYRLKNKERMKGYKKKYNKEYRLKNIERMKEYRNQYERERRKTDPNWKLRANLRIRIVEALKGSTKSKRTMELIGCTIDELWTHLESKFTNGMTRENHGIWHVDHIKACAKFDLSDPVQQGQCFHYTNLQPLWALDNMKKGAR
tara:strand:+ start:3956 stop:4495 length:540 start_codon:yes stop_codon:yes gene_type:complete